MKLREFTERWIVRLRTFSPIRERRAADFGSRSRAYPPQGNDQRLKLHKILVALPSVAGALELATDLRLYLNHHQLRNRDV